MKHLDLFSGIGGFAIAVDAVWPNSEHIFMDNDKFCQQVLLKHWPNSKIYGDIRTFITDTNSNGCTSWDEKINTTKTNKQAQRRAARRCESPFILTGGFPCQPFSQAGRRKGTADDRYLWPAMFKVIQLTKPTWVIAENVRGLVTWSDGLVLQQVCADLESEGYEVQPLIIPAVAVNAPHRRDRVWIIGHANSPRQSGVQEGQGTRENGRSGAKHNKQTNRHSVGVNVERERKQQECKESDGLRSGENYRWDKNWLEVATQFCSVDDGLPIELDGFKLTKAQHRVQQLIAYGNAIVPQVAIEIMKAIKYGS